MIIYLIINFGMITVIQSILQTSVFLEFLIITIKDIFNIRKMSQQKDVCFNIIQPSTVSNSELPQRDYVQHLIERVWDIHKQVLRKKIQTQSKQLVKIISQNISQYYLWERQNKRKKKLFIFRVQIKKGQQAFSNYFFQEMIIKFDEKFNYYEEVVILKQEDVQKEYNEQDCSPQLNWLKDIGRINIFQTQITSLPQLVFQLKKRSSKVEVDDLSIFLNLDTICLTSQMIQIFKEAHHTQCFVLVTPIYRNKQRQQLTKIQDVQVIPFVLLNQKELFQQLMFKCISDIEIKAYLPKQSIKLINDFEDFPISYTEGTHRLIYCIERLQIMRSKTKEFKYVDVKPLYKIMTRALKKSFRFFYQKQHTINTFIKLMLDPSEKFNLLRYSNSQQKKFFFSPLGKDQIHILQQFANNLISGFQALKDLQYSNCAKIIQLTLVERRKWLNNMKRKNFGFVNDKLHTSFFRSKLENKINQVIKLFTSQIHVQAESFSWKDFYFIDSIKPTIEYNIFRSVKQLSDNHSILIQYVYKDQKKEHQIVNNFCNKIFEAGQLFYYLKDLDLYGLIETSHKGYLDRKVKCTFYQKGGFSVEVAQIRKIIVIK